MTPLTWSRLTVVGLVSLVLAWLITELMERSGATPVPVPWTVLLVPLAAGAAALWTGWQVRQYVKGDRPGLDPLRAARTAVYAQACAHVGAILGGAYGGYALGLIGDWSHGPRRDVVVSALFGILGGAVMLAAGVIAERWCRHGGSDDDEGAARGEAAAA